MTALAPELQGAEEAVGRLTADVAEHKQDKPNVRARKADVRALLASNATLTAENEKLRGKVGELTQSIKWYVDYANHKDELVCDEMARAEAAEAQLATARRALEEIAQQDQRREWARFGDGGATGTVIDGPYAKIARAALEEPGP